MLRFASVYRLELLEWDLACDRDRVFWLVVVVVVVDPGNHLDRDSFGLSTCLVGSPAGSSVGNLADSFAFAALVGAPIMEI